MTAESILRKQLVWTHVCAHDIFFGEWTWASGASSHQRALSEAGLHVQQELQVVRIDIVEIVRELLLKHVLDSFLESHWLLILATHLSSASSPNTSAVCALVARTFVATWHPRPGKVSTLIHPLKPQLSTPLSGWNKNTKLSSHRRHCKHHLAASDGSFVRNARASWIWEIEHEQQNMTCDTCTTKH